MEESSEIPYLKTWALFTAGYLTVGFLVGVLAGGIIVGICALLHIDSNTVRTLGAVAGGVASLVVSFVLFKLVVRRFIVTELLARMSREKAHAA